MNAPARLLFPAAPKLLGAGNARALAVHAIQPYLKKVRWYPQDIAVSAGVHMRWRMPLGWCSDRCAFVGSRRKA